MVAPNNVTCRVIRPKDVPRVAKQGTSILGGISAQTAGARNVSLHLLTIPAGGQAQPHLHESHETAIYLIDGEVLTLYGEQLEQSVVTRTGDFLYIPAGMPHVPANLSLTDACICIVARTDANDEESVVLLPALNDRAVQLIRQAREGRAVA